ncbi:MAG TPA: response regulator transcription factor [Planktothrix sp.]|jgi:DNA-binding response OmpR family regulator
MAKILIVEDEVDLAELMANWLRKEQHLVELVFHGEDALQMVQINHYDLMILDLMLPGLDGLEICHRYRAGRGAMPILMVTARSSVRDKEIGLDLGADDYLTKPFDLKELAARVRAMLRRGDSKGDRYCIGDVVIELGKHRVEKNGVETRLLPQEYRLLEFFVRHPQHVFSAEQLLESVWESDSVAVDSVRGHIQRIRKKLDTPGAESIISTVHGLGYKVDASRC